MQCAVEFHNINLYLLKTVRITFSDGTFVSGHLNNVLMQTGEVLIDDATYSIDNMSDIEVTGQLNYHTYPDDPRKACEVDDLFFGIEDFVAGTDLSKILYGEFDCQVAFHLVFSDAKICAKDVRLLSHSHRVYMPVLSKTQHMYILQDNAHLVGILQETETGYAVQSPSINPTDIHLEDVLDIVRIPVLNEAVEISTRDGSVIAGTVSVATDSAIVLVGETVNVVPLSDITSIRYKGTISLGFAKAANKTVRQIKLNLGVKDEEFLCKLPYLRTPNAERYATDGAEATFVPGITDRGPIAKDVELTCVPVQEEEREYYGILLTVDYTRENGVGYIGNRFVAKSCGKPVDGRARFSRNLMNFETQYNKSFIVKYTATESPNRNLRIVTHMEVYKVLDTTKIGIIEVSDDGQIDVIPLFRASISRYLNRDVDVICTDGQTVSGLLQGHDDTGITVVQGLEEATQQQFNIPFEQIEDILLIGTVTQYYQNGTGYVDNSFFFHINEIEKSVDAQFVRTGIQLIFSLRNARKGNFVDCGDIRILHEKQLDVYVLGYRNKKYTVVDSEKYGKGVHFHQDAYEVPYSSFNQFRDLNNEDYHAILTLTRKAGVSECTYIRTLTNHPKLRLGIVTHLNSSNNTVTILSPDHYRKDNRAKTYPLALRNNLERLDNTAEKDYDVLYTLSVQNREYCATIAWVDLETVHNKCYFGYLETYREEDSSGVIKPEINYAKAQSVTFAQNALHDSPDASVLADSQYVYKVCYTLAADQAQPTAENVWLLEKVAKQSIAASGSAPAPAPAPAPEPVAVPTLVTEDIDLRSAYPAEDDADNLYFGIVTVYNPVYSNILIYQDFRNKKVDPTAEDFTPSQLISIPIPEGGVPVAGPCSEKIVTAKFIYLVRFAATKAEDGTLSFDYNKPLEFLREFRKTALRALSVEDGTLHIEARTNATKSAPMPAPKPTEVPIPLPKGATAYVPGETILVKEDAQIWYAGTVESTEEDRILLTDGRVVIPAEEVVIRFGVLTSFNENLTVGYLNGMTPFSFANMDSRTFNMVKTAKKQQLLWYTCQDDVVTHVERITNDFIEHLPFHWQYGTVSDFADLSDKRRILINSDIRYLMTVATGSYIWGMIKSDAIVGKTVFVKVVSCPYSEKSGVAIRQYALDIHSEQEISFIRYDAVADNYLASHNANSTQTVVVEGNRSVLSSLIDAQTNVMFRVTEDGRKLQAFIDKNDGESDWSEELPEEELEVSKVLMDSGLVQFLLHQVNLTTLQLPEGIHLTPEGWPDSHENIARLVLHLWKKSGRTFDFKRNMAMIALLERLPEDLKEETLRQMECRTVEGILWRTLYRQVRNLGLQNDCLWGEYSYYITTLLRENHSLERQKEDIYKLFLQDFYSRIEVMELLRQLHSGYRDRRRGQFNLQTLFKRNVLSDNISQLLAHMISLDETSVQHLVITEDVFEQNPDLTQQLLAWGQKIDSTQNFASAAVLIDHLRALYKNDKTRYTRELSNAANSLDILVSAERILKNISGRFLLLLTADDAQRFTTLHEICQSVLAERYAGYQRYQSALTDAWTKCSDLLRNAETHLTQESTDMLLKTGLIEAVLGEIGGELNALYTSPDYAPDVRCTSNYSEVVPSQENLILLVENGAFGRTNLQNAYNIRLHLEVMGGLSADSIPSLITLREKVLPAGSDPVVLDDILLDLSTLDGDMFSISVTAEYEYCTGFDGGELRQSKTADCGILEFQLRSDQSAAKNTDAVNYYLHPAEGNPLKETDEDDCRMFFGRQDEIKDIWTSLIDENNILREGRAIMLYGQKKCGKTSLINQIIGRMKTNEDVQKQAIIISVRDILEFNGGVTCLGDFSLNFYQNILDEFEEAVRTNHKDLLEQMEQNGLEIPFLFDNPSTAPALFQRFFRSFSSLDQGKHRVVLVMDEFTRLCTTIIASKEKHPEYQGIPNFIKLFSSMGFVQIIIGHPNMMRALSRLGIINHTAEFAKRIELSALKETDARALIREPMLRSFGFDVYKTVLGERAIEKLLDLSGCHPSVLMKLCDQMFQHYITTSHSQILIHDVEKMLNAYLPQLEASTTFDIMVAEDGDATAFFDSLPAFRYLKTVATESLRSNNRDCDINLICSELDAEEGEGTSEDTRETLISRRVLIAGNGRIKIPIELFLEYIRYRYETH